MVTMGDKVFLDTNVVIRANIKTAPLHEAAIQIIEKLNSEGKELWISRQILREYIAVVTRTQPYTAAPLAINMVQTQVKEFERIFHIADENSQTTEKLLQLLTEFSTGGKQVHDANIVATMLVYQIDTLVTHNVD